LNGVTEVAVEKGFGLVTIIADNNHSTASFVFPLDSKPNFRNLTVSQTLNRSQTYIEKDLCKVVNENEEFFLKDCENSYEIIDSLEKLYFLQKELSSNGLYSE
jgi:hypothetical protein